MSRSQWHKLYTSNVTAPPELLFRLVSDLPNYGDWLPGSDAFAATTDVEPYPVHLRSRYHDGKPDQPGKEWWGTVTGFRPPGSIDFHHTITVRQVRADSSSSRSISGSSHLRFPTTGSSSADWPAATSRATVLPPPQTCAGGRT